MKILFEDKYIAVCLKPAGILSQSGDGGDMISLLNAHFEQNGENIANGNSTINVNSTSENMRITLLEKDMELIKKDIEILKLKIKK